MNDLYLQLLTTDLYPHELIFLELVPNEKLGLLLGGHDHVLGHQLVLNDVDQQLRLKKLKQFYYL